MVDLVDKLYETYISNPNLHKNLCLFTMGLPASGKTTNSIKILQVLKIKPENIIHLDPDIIMEELKKIEESSNLSTLNRNSVIITSKLFNKLITNGDNFSIIYYGTGKNWSSYQTMINKAKKNSYTTGLINVKLDLESAIERNSMRGRSVGKNVITNIHTRLTTPLTNKTPKKYIGKTNYEVLSSLVDFVYTIDTSSSSPSILKAKGKKKNKKRSRKVKGKKSKKL
jgi:tRNA uridine 5-carbamoylmethylation protein Kti12